MTDMLGRFARPGESLDPARGTAFSKAMLLAGIRQIGLCLGTLLAAASVASETPAKCDAGSALSDVTLSYQRGFWFPEQVVRTVTSLPDILAAKEGRAATLEFHCDGQAYRLGLDVRETEIWPVGRGTISYLSEWSQFERHGRHYLYARSNFLDWDTVNICRDDFHVVPGKLQVLPNRAVEEIAYECSATDFDVEVERSGTDSPALGSICQIFVQPREYPERFEIIVRGTLGKSLCDRSEPEAEFRELLDLAEALLSHIGVLKEAP
jgi:hypothetical protein